MEPLVTGIGCGSYIPNVRSKADAMKYAFDITTEKNYSTGEVKINKDKAMEVYRLFVDNINLPDIYEDNRFDNAVDKYIAMMKSTADKDKKGE